MSGRPATRRLTVYSRQGCHLCELMIDALRSAGGNHSIEVVDVDTAPDLTARYGSKVPVLVVDGREVCHYRLDREALKRALRGD